MPPQISRRFLHSYPSDRILLGLLVLAAGVNAAALPAGAAGLRELLAIHVGLLAGFGACVVAMRRWEQAWWVSWLRPAATVVVIFTLYTSLGKLGIAAMPYLADSTLSRIDTKMLGFNPTFALQRFQTPGVVEFFSFIYAAFIPYINLSLFLGCLGRPPGERDEFLTGWVLTYAISYLGYIFIPARARGFSRGRISCGAFRGHVLRHGRAGHRAFGRISGRVPEPARRRVGVFVLVRFENQSAAG